LSMCSQNMYFFDDLISIFLLTGCNLQSNKGQDHFFSFFFLNIGFGTW
jgi:hypothetical protein